MRWYSFELTSREFEPGGKFYLYDIEANELERRLKAQVPSISEENNEIYRAHASSDQGSNESDESDEAVTGNLQVVIFSIHGLDRRYPTLKDSGLDRLDDTSIVEFSFDPSTIIGIEASPAGIEHAATELLERLSEYGDELGNYNQTSFIFLACDIGGSVLKQALIIASQTPRYLNVLEQTTALIFFGTPHRPPQKSSWELTLSFLVHNLFQGILGPWLPSTVSLLVAYHSKLAGEFDTIASRFKIINYYQEECNHNSYDVLVEKHSATFDRDGETQIGINQHHGLLSDLYTPEHKRLFISMIERAKATLRNDHKVWLRLLSRYDLHNIMYRTSKPIMRHLCNWILLKSGTYDWIGQSSPVPYDALVTSATLSNGCSSRASNDNQVTQPMVHIIHIQRELHGQSIHILSSLAAAIRDKYTDHSNIFITLNARNRSLPPTPVQLLAALFRQLLTSQPELVLKLKPLFGEAENALHGNAAAWSDDLLWRCLKIVLSSPSRSRVFLIIHEPDDPEQTSTFQKFNYSLRVLLNSAAIGVSWKVIFLRVASLGTRTLESRTISLDDEGFIAAQKDFEAESAAQYWLSHIGINSETSDTTSSYYQNPREDTYQKIRRQYTIDKLATVFDFLPCFKTFYRNRVYGILDYVPISLQSQARFGLTWICGSIRPLTMDELDEILRLGENTTSTRTSPVMTARDFVGFFPGILEIDDNKIFLWRRDLIEPSVVNSRDSSNEIQSDHFMIAQKCLRYLLNQKCFSRVSQPVLQGQVNLESKQSEALLRYAVEYWLAHAKASTNHAALDSGIFAEFLVDPSRVKLWLQLRESYQALHLEACPLISLPSLQILKKELGITTIEGLDLLLLASCTQASQKGDESDWSSIAVAAAQHSNRNILKRLHILGYLDQGETLATIFQTASDEILCQLLYEISGVVWNRIGIRHVFYNAIRRAKPRLAEMVVMSHREDLKFENERQLLLHMAENPLVTWPRSILDTQEAFIENVDQTESSRSRSPLHIAAKTGDNSLVSWLLERSPKKDEMVNLRDSSNKSPLHIASHQGHFAVVRQLLDINADVRAVDRNQETPLHKAAANGHFSVACLLLQHDSNIGARNSEDKTPLHIALENDFLDITHLLLKYAVSLLGQNARVPFNFDAQDSNGTTPLMLAAKRNYSDVVQVLLANKSGIMTSDTQGRTAFHLAAKLGFKDILHLFLEKEVNVDHADEEGNTALHFAARHGHKLCIEMLINAGASINICARDGSTPLSVACRWEQTGAVKALMRSDESKKVLNISILHAAVSRSFNVVHLLLDKGADKNTRNKEGQTALHTAAANSDTKLMQLLIFRGADIEIRDNRQKTPLLVAALSNSVPCMKMLLDAGATIDTEDVSGQTPIFLACKAGRDEMVQLFIDAGAPLHGPSLPTSHEFINFAFINFSIPIIRKIIRERYISIEPRTVSEAFDYRNSDLFDIMKLMIDSGLDPNRSIEDGKTILQMAVERNRTDIIDLLIESCPSNVDLEIISKKNERPLQLADIKGNYKLGSYLNTVQNLRNGVVSLGLCTPRPAQEGNVSVLRQVLGNPSHDDIKRFT